MKTFKFQSDKGCNLRKQTEMLLSEMAEGRQMVSTNDVNNLLRELLGYQEELEMQNDELRRAKMEIEETYRRYADLYDFAPVGYMTLNKKGVITTANLTAASMLGIERQQLIQRSFSLFINPEYQNLFCDHYRRVFESNIKQTCELELVKKDGCLFCVLMESAVAIDQEGNPTNECRSVLADITNRKQAEEKVTKIAESVFDAIIMIDENELINYWNSAAEIMFGYTKDEALGKNVHTLLLPEGYPYSFRNGMETFKANSRGPIIGQRIVLPVRRKDGSQFYAEHFFAAVRSDKGWNAISVIRDYTEQKRYEDMLRDMNEKLERHVLQRTEELQKRNDELRMNILEQKMVENALRMSQNRYRMLLESLPQSIFYKNKGLVYMSCNENYTRYLNIRPDEIYEKTAFDLFPENLAKKFEEEDKMVLASGKILEKEEKLVKNGKEVVLHTVKSPVRDEKGDLVGILGIFYDVTEKATLRMEAIRARQLGSLGELAAGVAHEINNPINSVINYAQILSNKSNDGSMEKDIASRIIKESDRIANIVNSLLSIARVRDKKVEMKSVSVNTLVNETFSLTGAQLRKDGVKVKLDIPQKLPKIYANEQQIQQVFLNVISNARYALNQKYQQKGEEGKVLEVTGEEITVSGSPQVKITFYDRGTGIPANILDKIGEPFFTTKPKGSGTGLGLSICGSIIREHGGILTFDSVEGEYCKVIILLPTEQKV